MRNERRETFSFYLRCFRENYLHIRYTCDEVINVENMNKAIAYATKKHDGQRRKAEDIPYISHPYRVAMLLSQQQCEEEVVITGILHDVVEDTDGTLAEISELFGKTVAALVEYASEPDKSLSWEERKKHTIETIKNAPIQAKLVVCADKIDNLSSISQTYAQIGDDVWKSFKRDYDSQKWYYTSVYNSLIHGIDEEERPALFTVYQKLLTQFFETK